MGGGSPWHWQCFPSVWTKCEVTCHELVPLLTQTNKSQDKKTRAQTDCVWCAETLVCQRSGAIPSFKCLHKDNLGHVPRFFNLHWTQNVLLQISPTKDFTGLGGKWFILACWNKHSEWMHSLIMKITEGVSMCTQRLIKAVKYSPSHDRKNDFLSSMTITTPQLLWIYSPVSPQPIKEEEIFGKWVWVKLQVGSSHLWISVARHEVEEESDITL